MMPIMRAAHHVVAVVDRLAGADAVEQRDVLQVVGVWPWTWRAGCVQLVSPVMRSCSRSQRPLRAEDQARILVVAVVDGAAEGVDAHALGEVVDHGVMVEDAAVNLAVQRGAAAHAIAAHAARRCAAPSSNGPDCGSASAARRRRRASGNGTGCWPGIRPPSCRGGAGTARRAAAATFPGWRRCRRWRRRARAASSPDIPGMVAALQPGDQTRPFWRASSHGLARRWMPTGSMACGFSTKTCLPASIAALAWNEWNLAALAMITTSEDSITCL